MSRDAALRAHYADRLGMDDPKACWDDIVAAAEAHGARKAALVLVGADAADRHAVAVASGWQEITVDVPLEALAACLEDWPKA